MKKDEEDEKRLLYRMQSYLSEIDTFHLNQFTIDLMENMLVKCIETEEMKNKNDEYLLNSFIYECDTVLEIMSTELLDYAVLNGLTSTFNEIGLQKKKKGVVTK
jgi:hypothetical protein